MSRFQALVEDRFRFLSELGFECQVEGDRSVRYQSTNGVFVRVFHDDREQTVDIRVGRSDQPADAASMDEIMRVEDAPSLRHWFPDIDDMLEYLVSRAAYKLDHFGQRALAGDPILAEQVKQLRQDHTHRPEKRRT